MCRKCGDRIYSRHTHDYVSCKCGGISVDGGYDYLRRSAKSLSYIIEASITMPEHNPRNLTLDEKLDESFDNRDRIFNKELIKALNEEGIIT